MPSQSMTICHLSRSPTIGCCAMWRAMRVLGDYPNRSSGSGFHPGNPDDEVVSHIWHKGLWVWGWGLNRPMVVLLRNLALQPNIWPYAEMGHR